MSAITRHHDTAVALDRLIRGLGAHVRSVAPRLSGQCSNWQVAKFPDDDVVMRRYIRRAASSRFLRRRRELGRNENDSEVAIWPCEIGVEAPADITWTSRFLASHSAAVASKGHARKLKIQAHYFHFRFHYLLEAKTCTCHSQYFLNLVLGSPRFA